MSDDRSTRRITGVYPSLNASPENQESPLPPSIRWAGPILAVGYGFGVAIHRRVSFKRFAPLATICVGNLTTGGTGKTPAVKYLTRGLIRRQRRPAVLMRGYKQQAYDEAMEVLSLNVPVITGADRYTNARLARERDGANVVVLDDGFQHWKLGRDLDLVLIDANDPFGGEKLLPWGRLREHPAGLKRAGVVVITHSDLVTPEELAKTVEKVKSYAPNAVLACARHRPSKMRQVGIVSSVFSTEKVRGVKVVAACGIGTPSNFRKTLRNLGADVVELIPFDDHHNYVAQDIFALQELAQKHGAQAVVVTEKDAVKLAHLPLNQGAPIWSVQVKFEVFQGEAELWKAVEASLVEGDKRKQKRVVFVKTRPPEVAGPQRPPEPQKSA